jgi:hypothetical protein
VCAQEFLPGQVVFPITDFTPDITYIAPFHAFTGPMFLRFGTGFCLDHECRFVGTTYHVAQGMGDTVLIKRALSAHRYLDSSPNDSGAEDMHFAGGSFPFMIQGSMRFNPAHDLAIYEMRHPLKKFHGIGFETDDLENDAEVDIYGYPFNWNPKRGLVCWHGKFIGKTQKGQLVFSYEEGQIRAGSSGGIVVDSKTKKIVGVLSGVAEDNQRVAYAVSIKELSEFVARVQPYLQTKLFPEAVYVSPMARDLYPPYIWPREGFADRVQEPPAVMKLRETSQHLADSMRNFAATETFSWGHDNREPDLTEAYDTLVLDGWQRWRRPRDGKWFYDKSPVPRFWVNPSIGTGDLWIRLPRMVGTELNIKIHQAPDAFVGGHTIHVFQYAANAEDEVCRVFWVGWLFPDTTKSYDCHGEVWTDASGTILRISEAIDTSGPLYHDWGVMKYGWLEKDGTKYLLPVTFAMQAEDRKIYWCRSLFTDYKLFNAKARLVLSSEMEQAQKSEIGAK